MCVCARVCMFMCVSRGFPWRRQSTGADLAVGNPMIYSFAPHISPSLNSSPAVFFFLFFFLSPTSVCAGH